MSHYENTSMACEPMDVDTYTPPTGIFKFGESSSKTFYEPANDPLITLLDNILSAPKGTFEQAKNPNKNHKNNQPRITNDQARVYSNLDRDLDTIMGGVEEHYKLYKSTRGSPGNNRDCRRFRGNQQQRPRGAPAPVNYTVRERISPEGRQVDKNKSRSPPEGHNNCQVDKNRSPPESQRWSGNKNKNNHQRPRRRH